MDSGRGHMETIEYKLYEQAEKKWPKRSGVFQIGEEIEVKNAWFKVHKITLFGIMLKAIKSKSTPERERCEYDHSLYQDKDASCPVCGNVFNKNF